MRCLLLLLCSQAIVFSAGFTTLSTLNSDKSQYKKSRNPECFMNVSPFLTHVGISGYRRKRGKVWSWQEERVLQHYDRERPPRRKFDAYIRTVQASREKKSFVVETEIIRYHGYPSEEYQVTTEDGYILGVFRIPAGRNSQNTGQKPVVFLQHAFLGDATHWISNLPNNSLGFLLADAGYDVWMGNSRGNTWSLKHRTLNPSQKAFWQFSFDEMGKYDIPAELYFIMNKTEQKDVYYVAHSEGTTAGFIAFSTYPELAKRVKMFCALGPVTTCSHATSPLVKIAKAPEPLLRFLFGHKGAFHQIESLKGPVTQLCANLDKFCGHILCYIAGGSIKNLNTSRTDTYVGHSPAGTSVQNIIHWHQIIYGGRFQAYDYGSKENTKKYNQSSPPAYKIEKISIPIAVWSGGQDTFADPRDMAKLLPRITNLIYHEHFPTWGHLDFIWGLDATERMYWKIIELIRKYF